MADGASEKYFHFSIHARADSLLLLSHVDIPDKHRTEVVDA